MVKDATDPCTITATLLPQVTQRAFDRVGSRLLVLGVQRRLGSQELNSPTPSPTPSGVIRSQRLSN
jgi:hypothetical protein